jgi:hypothetical protein
MRIDLRPAHFNFISLAGLGVLLVCSGIVQTRPAGQQKDVTFQISVPLEFKGRLVSGFVRKPEIAALLDLPVRNGNSDTNEGYGVEMTWPNNKKAQVYTCREWEKAREDQAYSATTYDMAMESSLIHTCGLLFELQEARAPLNSFIKNPKVTLANLDLLPAEILNSETEDPEGDRERLRGLTVSKVVPAEDIESVDDKELTLSYGGLEPSFWEAARADFNGSGFEELLVFTGGRAEGGTLGYSDYLILTRTGPSGPLRLVHTARPWETTDN